MNSTSPANAVTSVASASLTPETSSIQDLFTHNRNWAAQMEAERPGFFTRLVKQQTPKYMWIGCSDSRVPANQITGLEPGEVFVHRNVANIVVHSDLNALSAIQFAVERLKVKDIMVVGHYGCSGVQAALEGARIGLADNWIRHIQDVRHRHRQLLDSLPETVRANALCDINVIEQVVNVSVSTVMVDAWARGQDVTVHGWAFGVHDGLLQDLKMTVSSSAELDALYSQAIDRVWNIWSAEATAIATATAADLIGSAALELVPMTATTSED